MLKDLRSIIGRSLIIMCGFLMMNAEAMGGAATPQLAIQTYLDSLVQGDTVTLAGMIDGNMKERSFRLLTENPTYPDFLRSHYSGVSMTIENLSQVGENYNAQVRFDYPTSDSNTSIFVLSLINGQWKIVDEQGL